jgi:D-alanyl-D-alanine carboxypeptidase
MYKKSINWANTNKLLGIAGCHGLKTGYTPKAGGCLSTIFNPDNEDTTIVIIVLGCKTQDHRFIDTKHMMEWVLGE